MFTSPINENKIPPNFLNSILSNDALYEMFKNDFDSNADYFQNLSKNEYLYSILKFLTDKLNSLNLLSIFDEEDITKPSGVIAQIRKFYDDFVLPKIQEDCNFIWSIDLFSSLEFALKHDSYASRNDEFNELYDYIFTSSRYDDNESKFLNSIGQMIKEGPLSLKDFERLSDYAKNNRSGIMPMDLVEAMIKLHAYKENHIFDRKVVKSILASILYSYFSDLEIMPSIEYEEGIGLSKEKKTHDLSSNTIYIDAILVDTFISGNYVELLSQLFYRMRIFKSNYMLDNDIVSIDAFKSIMNIIVHKANIDEIFVNGIPSQYARDAEASAFVSTLKFLRRSGVDLFASYNESQIKKIELESHEPIALKKEISEEILFQREFARMSEEERDRILKKSSVVGIFYLRSGERKRAVDLLKYASKSTNRELVLSYLHSSIPNPEVIIDDILDLSSYKSTVEEIGDFISRLIKYIYADAFYYSLKSYIDLYSSRASFDKTAYLNQLYVTISALPDDANTSKFKVCALDEVDNVKQSL